MNTAIASSGKLLSSKMDIHFGRCAYFMIYDSVTKEYEFIPNPYKSNKEHAGCDVVNLLLTKNVQQIISIEIGVKVKALLDKSEIQLVIINQEKTMKEIISLLSKKDVKTNIKYK